MTDPNNIAVRAMRAAKIRSIAHALFGMGGGDDASGGGGGGRRGASFSRIVFLDTDTIVCAPLVRAVCAVDAPAHVAFVETPNRTHGDRLLKEAFGVSDAVPEANTGVLAMRKTDTTKRLLEVSNRARFGVTREL